MKKREVTINDLYLWAKEFGYENLPLIIYNVQGDINSDSFKTSWRYCNVIDFNVECDPHNQPIAVYISKEW